MQCIDITRGLNNSELSDWSKDRLKLLFSSFLIDEGLCKRIENVPYYSFTTFRIHYDEVHGFLQDYIRMCSFDKIKLSVLKTVRTCIIVIEEVE